MEIIHNNNNKIKHLNSKSLSLVLKKLSKQYLGDLGLKFSESFSPLVPY